MEDMIELMSEALNEAKCSEKSYLKIEVECDSLKADMIRDGYKWLKNIFDTTYKDIVAIKRLLPEEIWNRYKKWDGFSEHREMVLLKEALVKFRKEMISNARPDFFKSGKRSKALKPKKAVGRKHKKN
jgi:hypothetical protein